MTLRNPICKSAYLGLIFTIILLLADTNVADPEIDKEHMNLFPTCGKMSKTASHRLTNTEESKIHYPWVIKVLRYWRKKAATNGEKLVHGEEWWEKIGKCGGTILTRRLGKLYY